MADRRSWAHLTKSPRTSLAVGLCWLLVAAGQWWLLTGEMTLLRGVLAASNTALALLYLVAVAVRLRSGESLAPRDGTGHWRHL